MAITKATTDLLRFLESCPPGPIEPAKILELLAESWCDLDGSADNKMSCEKLHRLENPRWDGRLLSFEIERHGAAVLGSKYAEVHSWEIDPKARQARIVGGRRRQISKPDEKLDVKPLAREICAIITSGGSDLRVKRKADGSVTVDIKRLICETNKQTTQGRRKRFRDHLNELLKGKGWVVVKANTYRRSQNG